MTRSKTAFGAELADVVAHALLVAHRFGVNIEHELEKKWLVWARQNGHARKSRTCLCFVVDDRPGQPAAVLRGQTRRGLGAGNVLGLGGHVEDGEDAHAAALREVREEASIEVDPASLVDAAQISFRFPVKPAWDQDVDVFIATSWHGMATSPLLTTTRPSHRRTSVELENPCLPRPTMVPDAQLCLRNSVCQVLAN